MGIFPPCQSSEMFEKLLASVCGKIKDAPAQPEIEEKKIKGSVVLRKKNLLDVTDVGPSIVDRFYEMFGKGVSFQIISAVNPDPDNPRSGKLGKETYLEGWASRFTSLNAEHDISFDVSFNWDETIGLPGALIVRNHHHTQFYLKTVTLEDVPGQGQVHFVCDSWVYPAHRYKYDRVFFSNKTYLPGDTPPLLQLYREEELVNLRGNGSGMLQEWDRVYDYAYYNDLGSPEKGKDHARPALGGPDYPYPRRVRTGRKPNKKDPNMESRIFILCSINIYVPRDEKFNSVKFADFIGYAFKSLGQVIGTEVKSLDKTITKFNEINKFVSFKDVLKLYDGSIKLPEPHKSRIHECVPLELIRELARSDGERPLKFPIPDVIAVSDSAWRTDQEFGREMLAGVNPVIIRRLEEFPPKSKLDPSKYGNQDSTITKKDVEKNMNGLTVDKAMEDNKMFILDHHDAIMTYLRRINTTTTKTYATRTVLLLQDDGTLKPLAIELSLPHPDGDEQGAISEVFTPSDDGVKGHIWQLAKAYVAVNDSGYHQLISHWLNTHAVMEPFIIAANRQLSVLHPIYKLLKPHFRDTLHINALARQILINAGGVVESTVFPAKFALEMSSAVYRSWNFTDHALPQDLLKRGVAVRDPNQPHGLKLVIEDYPFAVDGLEIWSAIEAWVTEYCSLYYPTDEKVKEDTELQQWWKELREVGHGDLKDEPWWPTMETPADVIKSCTTIVWVASALHAAVNFGQYPFAGYLPNRPTVSRRLMPTPDTPEYDELEKDPELAYLKTITAQFQTLLGVSLIEILSRHSTDEIYLGQRDIPNWTTDNRAIEAFDRFSEALIGIETRIRDRNGNETLRNRSGPVKMEYNLLYPNTSDFSRVGGLTGKGIPNSISI